MKNYDHLDRQRADWFKEVDVDDWDYEGWDPVDVETFKALDQESQWLVTRMQCTTPAPRVGLLEDLAAHPDGLLLAMWAIRALPQFKERHEDDHDPLVDLDAEWARVNGEEAPPCGIKGCDRLGVIPVATATAQGSHVGHYCLTHAPDYDSDESDC